MRARGARRKENQKALPATREAGPRLIHVRLSEAIHRALRIHVAAHDTSIQNWVAALIERELAPTKGEHSIGEGAHKK